MLFCRHDWEVKDKTVLPSAGEQLGEDLITKLGSAKLPLWVFTQKVVITLACKKCGSLRVVREQNP